MKMPPITNSNTAAAAAEAIRIFLRFSASGLRVVVLGSADGTGHFRLDALTDAVWANMSGVGGGNDAPGPRPEADASSARSVRPDRLWQRQRLGAARLLRRCRRAR